MRIRRATSPQRALAPEVLPSSPVPGFSAASIAVLIRGRHENCIHVSPAVARVLPGRDGGHAPVVRAFRKRRALHPPPRPDRRLSAGTTLALRKRWTDPPRAGTGGYRRFRPQG